MEACTALCGTFSCALGWVNDHAALGVALIALWFTWRQVRIANRHNRLSVRPHLVFWLNTSTSQRGNPTATVTLKNVGLGPAYLESAPVWRVDGQAFDALDPAAVSDAMEKLFGQKFTQVGGFEFRDEYAIAKDDRLTLVEFEVDPSLTSSLKDTLLKRVGVEISYESAYEEPFTRRWP